MGNREVQKKLDHLFRHEYGSIVSGLTIRFGSQHINLIEDSVQEALFKAMKLWSYDGGIPEKPGAWLYRVAYNKTIDQLRRESKSSAYDNLPEEINEREIMRTSREIEDEQLKMIFACCNPLIHERDSLLLSLKLIGGFSVSEIARSLLLSDEAAKKSIQRARQHFRDKVGHIHFPEGKQLQLYIDRVLKVIYLIFNEGYKASNGDALIKEDLCGEAIRLALVLSGHEFVNDSRIEALISLMSFKAARFKARLDDQNRLMTLENQDRKQWTINYIRWGFYYFGISTKNADISAYHLEAGIEYQYHIAEDYSKINWKEIQKLYRLLIEINPGAVVRLNYIVVLARAEGAERALSELEVLKEKLSHHYMFYAVKADLLARLNLPSLAITALEKAIRLTDNTIEKEYMSQKIELLSQSV